jgi:hypothetical protein
LFILLTILHPRKIGDEPLFVLRKRWNKPRVRKWGGKRGQVKIGWRENGGEISANRFT